MAFSKGQTILAGPSILLVGNVFTSFTSIITDVTTGVVTAIATTIPVSDVNLIAPNVAITGAEADPPVMDIIVNTRTSEIMSVISKSVATGAGNLVVVRGISKWRSSQSTSDTTYNVAMLSGDELQHIGFGSMPDYRVDYVITDTDVVLESPYETFQTRTNLGFENSFTSAPSLITLTLQIPKNTLPQFKNVIGGQRISDLQTIPEYKSPMGNYPAGTELIKKLILVIPLTQWARKATITIGGDNFYDFSNAFLLPNACIDPSEVFTGAEGAQTNIEKKFFAYPEDVFNMSAFHGIVKDANRMFAKAI